MKNPAEQHGRWLAQSEHQLGVTKILLDNRQWSDACFNAEQTAKMAMKALLFGAGCRFVPVYSAYELSIECAKVDESFRPLVDKGRTLDRFYLQTRYPDVLAAPAVPFESFTEADASQAYQDASDIVEMVTSKPGGPETSPEPAL